MQAYIRRLEIIEFQPAADDWQLVGTRHIFREQIPRSPNPPFLTHHHLPALTNLRAASKPRALPPLDLTPSKAGASPNEHHPQKSP